MITINQTMLTVAGLKDAETANHAGSFEYLPYAKDVEYLTLSRGNAALFLSIKVIAPNNEKKETELIESQAYMSILVCSNRVLSKYIDSLQYELLSISYQPSLNTLKSEGIMINALLALDDEDAMELPADAIRTIEQEIAFELGIIEEKPQFFNEDSLNESAPVKSNILKDISNGSDEVEGYFEENTDIIETITEKNVNDVIAQETEEIQNSENSVLSKFDNSDSAGSEFESETSRLFKKTDASVASETNNKLDKQNETSDTDNIDEDEEDDDIKALMQKFEAEKAAIRKKKQEKLEAERLEKERAEKERLERERAEKERLERERAEKEKNKGRKKQGMCDSAIISLFYDSVYGKDNISDLQQDAYQNATEEEPFLNKINTYVPMTHLSELEESDPEYEIYEEDAFIQTTASKQMLNKCFNQILTYFMDNEHTSLCRVLRGEIEMDSFIQDIEMYMDKHLKIPVEDKDLFMNRVKRAFFSYYVLTPAINDKDISDIRVLSPDKINVKVHGEHYTAKGLKFIHENDYMRFIESLIIKNRIYVGEHTNILVFTDKDYHPDYILRFNICLPAINSTGLPYLHIRKVPKKKTTLADLIRDKMLDEKVATYLLDKVSTSKGIIFSGPSASGKTTLMNALIDYVPKKKSILCIQESEELFSEIHPNAYFQHMLKDAHGQTIIGLSELGTNGLLCDSGYFIIGECKGAEARDLLRASNTGHNCWCSIHAQSSQEAITRLADYVKLGADYTFDEAVRMLKDLDVIVYIQNYKVKEISEIAGYDEEKKKIIYKPIYRNPFFES